MIRTTIRLPQELHEKLRTESFKTGKSINEIVIDLIQNKYKGEKEMINGVKIYTNLTGTSYDVQDFLEELENYIGEINVDTVNERIFYSTLQKIAIQKGYKVVWITQNINKKVTLGILVNSPESAVVGFGIATKGEEGKLNKELEIAKEKLENATDEERDKALWNHYKTKAEKYKMSYPKKQ